jgi:hypothetical protein
MPPDTQHGRGPRHGDQYAPADTTTDTAADATTDTLADGTLFVVPPETALTSNQAALPATDPPAFLPVAKGFNYVADVNGSYADANSLASLKSDGGGNAVALTSDYGIDAQTSTVYADDVDGGYTESDANVAATISDATALGLSVMVRPLIDFLPSNYDTAPGQTNPKNGAYSAGEFRSYYNPTDPAAFFASYQTMIVHEATLAQANGAGLFCIGVELDQLTGPAYETYWDNIIAAVRGVFSGKLTYSADWDDALSPWQYGGSGLPAGTGDITTQISFWNKLDYVGIDNYAPISDLANPTLNQLVAGWTQTPTDAIAADVTGSQSLISYYQGVAATIGLPLLFTETGYANASDADSSPATPGYDENGNPDGATADPTLQANLMQAFFDAWQQNGNGALAGAYLWNWEPGGAGVSPFSVQGLAAEPVVKAGYTACYAAGTRIATPSGETAVEKLHVGDLVATLSGAARPVIWLGHRIVRFDSDAPGRQPHPIRVLAHAFAAGQPSRNLMLSPDHAVFVDGVLIPIRRLVNGATIRRDSVAAIAYWHVELASHDILLAEGLPAESYLDTGNRAAFANARATAPHSHLDPARVWAEQACAPLVEDGAEIETVRRRLAERARLLGCDAPPIQDVALEEVGPLSVIVAADADAIRLVSSTARPPGDGRRLGALVTGLRIDGAAIGLGDARLIDGFHDIETDGAAQMRWTDGAAILALGAAPMPRRLELDIALVLAADAPVTPAASSARPCG